MPNWCFATVKIYDNKEENIKNLFNLIKEWTKENAEPNGFGTQWLGNIVIHSGIGSANDKKQNYISCKGSINYLELQNDHIYIEMTTAWTPCLKMWNMIAEKYLSEDYEILYTADEPGNGIFDTNDSDYIGTYSIESYSDIDSEQCVSEDELKEYLKNFLNVSKQNISLDELIKLNERLQPYEDYFSIRQWEEKPIESWY